MALQTNLQSRQQELFIGFPSRPFADCFIRSAKLYVPTNGTAPKPGDAVVWNNAQKAFTLPTSGTQSAALDGIIVLSQQITGVSYEDGQQIDVLLRGTIAVKAGNAVGYGNLVRWQTNDQKWDAASLAISGSNIAGVISSTNSALNVEKNVRCISYDGAVDNGIFELAINII